MESAALGEGVLVAPRSLVSRPATLYTAFLALLLASILAGLWAWSSQAVMFPLEVICLR